MKFRLRGYFEQGNLGDNLTVKIFEDQFVERYGPDCLSPRDRDIDEKEICILAGGGIIDRGATLDYALHYFSPEKKSHLIGVGVNPINNETDALNFRSKLGSNYLLTVRDEQSAHFAKRCGVYPKDITADVCWMYNSGFKPEKNSDFVGVVVSVLPQIKDNPLKLYTDIKTHLKSLGYRIFWFPFGEISKDLELIQELKDKNDLVSTMNFEHQNDFFLYFSELSKLKFLVNTRLHGLIMSATMNLPSFTFSYSYKIEEILSKLGISRFSALCSDGNHTVSGSEDLALDKFKYVIKDIDKFNISRFALGDFRAKALKNFDYLFESLDEELMCQL